MTHPSHKPDQLSAHERVHTSDTAPGKPLPDPAEMQHLDYNLRALTVHGLDHYIAPTEIDGRFHVHG
jgi:hypothetical protein